MPAGTAIADGAFLEILVEFEPTATRCSDPADPANGSAPPFGLMMLSGSAEHAAADLCPVRAFFDPQRCTLDGAPLTLEADEGLVLHAYVDLGFVEFGGNNQTINFGYRPVLNDTRHWLVGGVGARSVDVWELRRVNWGVN